MLRTNLSTRPFYNTRIVRVALIAIAVVAAGLTVFNAVELWRLQRANREFSQTVKQNEEAASDLRAKALSVQQSLDRARLARVDAAAREANALIDRRAFSWTELLNQFQATLPPSVRITSVQPQVDDDGEMLVAITVLSRQQEDLDSFIAALEKTGVFRDVLPRSDSSMADGTLLSVLQAFYHVTPSAAITPPPASEPGAPPPVNRSAANVVAGGRP
jgi:Tfp pilus assembly protein PilN